MVHVPYKGSPESIQALANGRGLLQLRPAADRARPVSRRQGAAAGRQHQVARRHPRRRADGGGGRGLPGFENVTWYGLIAPKGLDPKIAERINAAVRKAQENPAAAREAGGHRHLGAQRDARAVPRHREGRPRQVGGGRQGVRRQDRLRRSGAAPIGGRTAAEAGRAPRPTCGPACCSPPLARSCCGSAPTTRWACRAASARDMSRACSASCWPGSGLLPARALAGGRMSRSTPTIAWRPAAADARLRRRFRAGVRGERAGAGDPGRRSPSPTTPCPRTAGRRRWGSATVLALFAWAAVRQGPATAAAGLVQVIWFK